MSRLLFQNIRQLLQVEQRPRPLLRGKQMSSLPVLEEAYLLIEDGRIADFGSMENCPERADEEIDARGRLLLPCWCDSHTHLVFAGSREGEFTDRIRGLSYEEIASRGGGILNSAKLLRQTPEEDLFEQSWGRLKEIIAYGTGAVEIKSGYGLSLEGELKMLRVIRRLREAAPIPVKATFLGAHALPEAYRDKREAYLRLLIDDLLPRIAGEGLADYIDVFCERNFFNLKETEQLLEAGARYGLRPKIHTNQFNAIGGISAAVRHHAVSVDHLEVVADADIEKDVPEKKEAVRGTETILLVEDEPTILRMTRMMLERNGYTVLSEATPAEAMQKAKSHSSAIDLLMTDVVMPEMNGRDLAEKIIALHPDIKLLFMSGYTEDIIAHQGVLDKGVAFIQKPFSMTDMTKKVRDVLDMASDKNNG